MVNEAREALTEFVESYLAKNYSAEHSKRTGREIKLERASVEQEAHMVYIGFTLLLGMQGNAKMVTPHYTHGWTIKNLLDSDTPVRKIIADFIDEIIRMHPPEEKH